MNAYFPEIKNHFGFGMMRLPMAGEDVDVPQTCKMVDDFIAAGFNYFDTAYFYIDGKSEFAVRDCVSKRYPRESFLLADKLTASCYETEADILPLFNHQLEKCGVDYFDFYLIHANNRDRHVKYTETRAYAIAQELKAQGKIRHVGMSFHDTADVLDKILTDRPEMEFVQLQLNYVDWEDVRVQARKCYDVCRKHGKPIMVMEPVKGGSLVNLPAKALELFTDYSPAGYAIRYCASLEGVAMVLSGMSSEEQMADNLKTMTNFQPLTEKEQEIIAQVRTIYQAQNRIPCTVCRYCTEVCPAGIPIPDIFSALNDKRQEKEGADEAYAAFEVKADACLECGRCEEECPQHLHIRELLKEAHKAFA
jgi:predicted aldo/keto reductase-like oxidoreductase